MALFLPGVGFGGSEGTFTPTPGAWNEYEVSWDSTLQQISFSVDGNLISQTTAGQLPANGQIVDALTVGGNFRLNEAATDASRTDADFEGSFNGLIDNFLFDGRRRRCRPYSQLIEIRGSMSLENSTDSSLTILGYRITSNFQSLDASNWTSIAANGDADSGGSIDPDDNWTELSPNPNFSLSEFESDGGNGATLPTAQFLAWVAATGVTTFGPWNPSPTQDVQMELLLPDGTIDQSVDVVYTGNDGIPFQRSDLDVDGDIDAADWNLYRSGLDVDLTGLTLVEAY